MDPNTHSEGQPTGQPPRQSVRRSAGQPAGQAGKSTGHPTGHAALPPGRSAGETADQPAGGPDGLALLAAAVKALAAQDLHGLADVALAAQVLALRRLLDRLEGQWRNQLAAVDGRGAAGADQGTPAPSTASWLGNRLQLSVAAATSAVRTPPGPCSAAPCRPPRPP